MYVHVAVRRIDCNYTVPESKSDVQGKQATVARSQTVCELLYKYMFIMVIFTTLFCYLHIPAISSTSRPTPVTFEFQQTDVKESLYMGKAAQRNRL